MACEESVRREIGDYFKFDVPNAFWARKNRKGWDGKISLMKANGLLYRGLKFRLKAFLEEYGYEYDDLTDNDLQEVDLNFLQEFVEELDLPFDPYDYQFEAIRHTIRHGQSLLISPTSSGKTFIAYLIARFFDVKTLITVPRTSLVYQLYEEFVKFGWDKDDVNLIGDGMPRAYDKGLVISTWQSVWDQEPEVFENFGLMIADEAHEYKAKALKTMMEKTVTIPHKVGMTGSLNDTLTHEMQLEGFFGPKRIVKKLKELMDENRVAQTEIRCLELVYPADFAKSIKKYSYHEEMEALENFEPRMDFVEKLVSNLKPNTIVLFNKVEHGKKIYERLKSVKGFKVFYIDGTVKGDKRYKIQEYTEKHNNVIIVASYGTFSTGISIDNLHNLVLATTTKSSIRLKQSIGRILRLSKGNRSAYVYDLADNVKSGRRVNFAWRHFEKRLQIYVAEKHRFRMKKVTL